MSNESSSGSVILGTLIGAAMGFAAGMLLAPAKGKETRDLLGEKANDLGSTVSDATNRAISSLKELQQSAARVMKREGNNVANDAERKAREVETTLKNA